MEVEISPNPEADQVECSLPTLTIVQFTEEERKYAATSTDKADVGVDDKPNDKEEEPVQDDFPLLSPPPSAVIPEVRRIIKPRPRSVRKVKLCLFCMYDASPPEAFIFPQTILGAVGCTSLQKELQSFFIMRQLLDIPPSWIHSQVREAGKGRGLQEWFDVCDDCFQVTCQAWGLYQNLLSLTSQLKDIKEKLKGRIKESTKRYRSRIDSELVKEIRRYSRSKRPLRSRSVKDEEDEDFCGVEILTEDFEVNQFVKIEGPFEDPLADVPLHETKVQKKLKTKLDPDDGDVDYYPPSFNDRYDELDDDFMDHDDDGAYVPSDTDDLWEQKPIKKRKRSGKVGGMAKGTSPKPKKKRIRDRTRDKKRKRIWKKKPPKWPFRCDICPAKYKVESEFKSHKGDHERNQLNNRIYDCNFCQYPCLDLDELETHKYDKHLRSSNSRLMTYRCKKCPFTVQFYYVLEEHVRQEHPDVPEEECGLISLVCKICNQKSATAGSAILHKKLMHPEVLGAQPEASTLLECEECGEKFDNKIRLKFHQNGHIRHKQEEQKYTCEICGKGFKWQSRLRAHTPVHNEQRQWVCSLCGLDFTYKNALVRHNQRYHPQADLATATGSGEAPEAVTVNMPDFQCKICDERMPAALKKRHMKIHEESFQYKCDQCDRSYTTAQGLRRHRVINHSNGERNAKCEYCNKEFIHVD